MTNYIFLKGQSKNFTLSMSGESLSPTYSSMSSGDEDPGTTSSLSDNNLDFGDYFIMLFKSRAILQKSLVFFAEVF